MKRIAVVVGLVLLFLAILVVAQSFHIVQFRLLRAPLEDDEAPIIVKNGTMDLTAGVDGNKHWKWRKKQDSSGKVTYVHEPKHLDVSFERNNVVVIVRGQSTTTCSPGTFMGDAVKVTYSDGFYVTVDREVQTINYRTSFEPSSSDDLKIYENADPPYLQHPDSGSIVGHISSLDVDNVTKCTFANKESLTKICIASKDSSGLCQ